MEATIKNSIAIKYHLNMHLMESLITEDSIAFELIRYIIKDIKTNNKELTLENLKFTSKTLKYIFGDLLKNNETKEFIVSSIKKLITYEQLTSSGKTMYVTREMLVKFYDIK